MLSKSQNLKLIIYIDGASRGNPGPAGIGVVIKDEKGNTLKEYKKYLGDKLTNNQAEYLALISALELCKEITRGEITIFSDSELLVRQLTGIYRVRNQKLMSLLNRVRQLEKEFEKVNYIHIRRTQNKKADLLANKAIDEGLRNSK